jgi:hypothetical protein
MELQVADDDNVIELLEAHHAELAHIEAKQFCCQVLQLL